MRLSQAECVAHGKSTKVDIPWPVFAHARGSSSWHVCEPRDRGRVKPDSSRRLRQEHYPLAPSRLQGKQTETVGPSKQRLARLPSALCALSLRLSAPHRFEKDAVGFFVDSWPLSRTHCWTFFLRGRTNSCLLPPVCRNDNVCRDARTRFVIDSCGEGLLEL